VLRLNAKVLIGARRFPKKKIYALIAGLAKGARRICAYFGGWTRQATQDLRKLVDLGFDVGREFLGLVADGTYPRSTRRWAHGRNAQHRERRRLRSAAIVSFRRFHRHTSGPYQLAGFVTLVA